MRITKFVRITAGKRHAWYETSLGFNIRKPLGVVKAILPEIDNPANRQEGERVVGLWERFVLLLKGVWKWVVWHRR